MREKLQIPSSPGESLKPQSLSLKEASNIKPQPAGNAACTWHFKMRSIGISYGAMRTTKHQKVTRNQSPAVEPTSGIKRLLETPLVLHEEKQEHRHAFDLEERTAVFRERIVKFSKKIPRDPSNDPLRGELVRCGTSIGANYYEATEGVSKKDFRHPVSRCKERGLPPPSSAPQLRPFAHFRQHVP
jgi:hypothetical protein